MNEGARSEVNLPLWLKVAFERFAAERTFRWRGRYAAKDDPASQAYEEFYYLVIHP